MSPEARARLRRFCTAVRPQPTARDEARACHAAQVIKPKNRLDPCYRKPLLCHLTLPWNGPNGIRVALQGTYVEFAEGNTRQIPDMAVSIPVAAAKWPPWRRNADRHAPGILTAIKPERWPSWPGIRNGRFALKSVHDRARRDVILLTVGGSWVFRLLTSRRSCCVSERLLVR